MLQEPRSVDQRLLTGLVFAAMRKVIPDQFVTMRGLLIDADHAVARLPQEGDQFTPSGWIVPIFALRCTLGGDTHVTLGDRSRLIGNNNARSRFCRIDSQDIGRGSM